jgi:UDP-N-acetylmuramate dehydrogenase
MQDFDMNLAKIAAQPAKLLVNQTLQARNTFALQSTAEFAYEVTAADELPVILQWARENQLPWRVLGGGSNVILPAQLPGLTLLMNLLGIKILPSADNYTSLSVGAGVNWHEFVQWTLEHNLPGLENLALIPGTVGAAPIQNIGAYGLEIGEYIERIEAFDTRTHTFVTLSKAACQFAYRDSYFKRHPNCLIVTKVVMSLPKNWVPRLSYADLSKQFADAAILPTAQAIFTAVCKVRSQKLPDPKVIGNAGSFFQNPVVDEATFTVLLQRFPKLVSYPDIEGKRKLAAGWLIDQCGLKGFRLGPVGVYEKQALVLVNHGGGTAQEILNLAQYIQEKVFTQFGISLEIEPNIF